ncbi:hypothetical protein [Thioalkalivibrio sp. ALE19]|uniref:hypothetical protein n=1 Tax=Thioalkalivibrio sp. ALE19 TaxID=1266909 RepID=UPI0003FFCC74|nr:hypothetical protein [Thioalkalivibrio sp. ALE19]
MSTSPRFYAGIGSRATPVDVQDLMRRSARALAARGFVLRSGGAEGADQAFEAGADDLRGAKTIYRPEDDLPDWAFATVDRYHPAPERLKRWGRRLMARNALQVLGPHGDDPVAFVLCWTPRAEGRGGTGQALRIAADFGIPVFDLARPSVRRRVERFLSGTGEEVSR